jgi:dihydrofolate synthase / folylpolyglutamate synthase
MTKYQQTLQFLYQQLPMYQRQGAVAFKKDLTNIQRLDEALGHQHRDFRSIHVAGTNGKGSTCHMLAAILTSAGYKTGLYTSPHFKDFRERIRIDGRMMPKRAVVEFVEAHRPLIEDGEASFFELSVAMAFWHFSREKVDIAVVETGLGGRLDSTNIVDPILSVITNIGRDHMNFLGDTLALIAAEKAGIIKPEVPVVISERQAETTAVFSGKAAALNAPITYAGDHFTATQTRVLQRSAEYRVEKDGALVYPALNVQAQGIYQQKNIPGVLQSIEVLRENCGLDIPEAAVLDGLRKLRSKSGFQGRWQWLHRAPRVVCDSAHNESGLEIALGQLLAIPHDRLLMVVGFVNDKELDKMLAMLPKKARYYFVKPDIPRGLDDKALQTMAKGYGLKGSACGSVKTGLQAAMSDAGPDDLVYVGGSCFVVAEVV